MADLTHFDKKGNAVMVDVGGKADTKRRAVACGAIHMQSSTLKTIKDRGFKKGDVLAVAQLAGIMAAKKTADLIPLCHPLALSHISVILTPKTRPARLDIEAVVQTTGPTGVEMEALTAVSVAALTVYDMCKAVDRAMEIHNIRLVHKSGGKSGTFQAKSRK